MTGRTDKPLVVTAGEPAGIGPDLCIMLAETPWAKRIVVVADPDTLHARAAKLGRSLALHDYESGRAGGDGLAVLAQPLPNATVCGAPDPANAAGLLDGLRSAVAGCRDGRFRALVTAPLQKSAINDAGIAFSGHTEFLAGLTNAATPVMLLVADTLRVALATTHLPLKDVPAALTSDGLVDVLRVLHADLVARFGIASPKIAVCGLNPHAGEAGHLGSEDRDVIQPAIEACRKDGIDARGPLPADTAFLPAAGPADAILAMYHDQGLPVVKFAGFGHAVNVTLGLPIVRTSVDHGTALDRAGTGTADPGSLEAAIALADRLASAS